ncbi:MAG: cupin domain-containing protein [Myxococcales bacterium]
MELGFAVATLGSSSKQLLEVELLRLRVCFVVGVVALVGCASTVSQTPRVWKKAVLTPELTGKPWLSGPPETGGMRSGYVVLAPGKAMHRHSTNANEETLVFLQGQARVLLNDQAMELRAGEVLYIPPATWHEVHNGADTELRYVFVVSPAKEP